MQRKLVLLIAAIVVTLPAHAHVKWFSMTANCSAAPITTLKAISSPLFVALAIAAFGRECTPERPLGAPMVSSEGACAAYYRYGALNHGR